MAEIETARGDRGAATGSAGTGTTAAEADPDRAAGGGTSAEPAAGSRSRDRHGSSTLSDLRARVAGAGTDAKCVGPQRSPGHETRESRTPNSECRPGDARRGLPLVQPWSSPGHPGSDIHLWTERQGRLS